MSPLSIRTLILAAGSAAIATALDVVAKDVVIIGGGASGAYAAFRLREDYGQSIALIEKEEALGGHVDSWTDPEAGRTYDTGVVTFIDAGNATSFMERLGLDLGNMPRAAVTQEYFDFETGGNVPFKPQPFPVQLAVLDKFRMQAEKFEPLIQAPGYFNFPEPEEIPDELLMPFGEWISKHELQDAMPFIYSSTGLGLGNMTNEITLFALQAFGASMARSTLGLQGSFVPASLRNQDIYDAIADVLGDDVHYQSTVVDSWRTDYGVSVLVRNSATNKVTFIAAKRLLISIPPTEKNTAPFDLDEEETEVLGKIEYNNLYTGLIDNSNLAANWSYFNMPAGAAPDNYFVLPEAPFTARIDAMGDGSHFRVTFIGDGHTNPCDAKAIVQRDFDKLIEAGVIAPAGDGGDSEISWVDFSVHGPMHARVAVEEIKAGFFQRFNALQGLRSTWWTGGAWAVNFQTHLWEYDDMIIPLMLEGLV